MFDEYPVVLIPDAIEDATDDVPPTPEFNEYMPPEPQPINDILLLCEFVSLISFLILCNLVIPLNISGFLLIVFMGLTGISIQAFMQKRSYPQRRIEWEKEYKLYDRKLQIHKKNVALSRTEEKIAEYRQKQLSIVLSRTREHDGINKSAKRGNAEAKFETILTNIFPGKIRTGCCFKIPNYQYPYTVDFAYIGDDLKLMIDIEIDEPYAYESKDPTHYIGRDDKRNDFFLERNWIVIRFAEEQVVKEPKNCCRVIADTISSITGQPIPKTLINLSPPKPIKQWTKEEAKDMAYSNYRNYY